MAKKYIGNRYSLLLAGDWDSSVPYERLTLVLYDDKGYVSKTDVPAGTLPTDTAYWMLLYNNTINITNVSWQDIADKPTEYTPSYHTQDWMTITGKPTQYPPSAHTHAIAEVNGLPVTISDIQQDIKDLQDGGGQGIHITQMYADSFTGSNLPVNNYVYKKYSNNYIEYDCYFIVEEINVRAYTTSGGWGMSNDLYPPITLPVPFAGKAIAQVTFTKNALRGIGNITPFPYIEEGQTLLLPSLRLGALKEDASTIGATGTVNISLRGF